MTYWHGRREATRSRSDRTQTPARVPLVPIHCDRVAADPFVMASGYRAEPRGINVEGLRSHRAPDIFNTDQGAQFTSNEFIGRLREAGIRISMDGRGRALDNIFVERLWRSVKWEDIYPKGYEKLPELHRGLTEYFLFYNGQRPHQSLRYRTPDEVHQSAQGGGVVVVDRFNANTPEEAACHAPTASTGEDLGQRQTAATGTRALT